MGWRSEGCLCFGTFLFFGTTFSYEAMCITSTRTAIPPHPALFEVMGKRGLDDQQ